MSTIKLTRIEAIDKIEEELAALKVEYSHGMLDEDLQKKVDVLNNLAKELDVAFSCDVGYIKASQAAGTGYEDEGEDEDSWGEDSWDEDADSW